MALLNLLKQLNSMVRVYSYYNFGGGFRTYRIECLPKFLLNKSTEINTENRLEFPLETNVFFSHGGIKIIYLDISQDERALVIREIPSLHTDSEGRRINCDVQFIGRKEDYFLLDNLAITISNDILNFEKFFANLFFVREGPRVDGDKLGEYIEENRHYYSFFSSKLADVQHVKSKVKLIVPLTEHFGYKDVREELLSNLKLTAADIKNSIILSNTELKSIQLKIEKKEMASDPYMDESESVINDTVKVSVDKTSEEETALKNSELFRSNEQHSYDKKKEEHTSQTQNKESRRNCAGKIWQYICRLLSTIYGNRRGDEDYKRLISFSRLFIPISIALIIILILN